MDYFSKLARKIALYTFAGFVSIIVASAGLAWLSVVYVGLPIITSAVIAGSLGIVFMYMFASTIGTYVTEPLKVLSQAILHVTPGEHGAPPPNLDKLKAGRELVTNLSLQVYQLASHTDHIEPLNTSQTSVQAQAVLDELPLPIFVSDKTQIITYTNNAAARYLGKDKNELIGQNLYSALDFSFSTTDTLDAWLAVSRANTVTASRQWDRVRLALGDNQQTRKQLDLAAYYNKNNPSGAETVLALFDKTKFYSQDDDGISFIALAVHELRTPLTILRGYIEVLEEEAYDELDSEMQDFMRKMQAAAEQLSSFVSNILNVARVEENQLFLQLHEEDWKKVLTSIIDDIRLRADVHGKRIKLEIEPGLPTVAVDHISVYEVVNNLLENAIKYSDASDEIVVKAFKRDDGTVETTVQDFGIGIPTSILGNLFEKFYRNHRSRAEFGGTGLGLYLAKAIITAHGGQIWVQSKEGEGSTFGFTLQPYSSFAEKEGNRNNKGVVRTAHGWIKNHSFYKR